jgi:2'-5' RNA ligase
VTGVQDEVDDVIVPGAFTKTLQRRRPKTVKAHDWKTDVGRVLHVEEWLPGDRRLPRVGPDGKAWPADAGALVATMQFNLAVQRGREEFEMVRFYAQSNEACFSIGYRVLPGKASKRADGVRMIYELELFEVSPVLFGAHPLTMALEVKEQTPVLERKNTGGWGGKTGEPNAGTGRMVALYPPQDVAEQLAHPDGTAPDDLHVTLAFIPDSDMSAAHLAQAISPAAATAQPLSGEVGGLGQFPAGDDGTPTYVPVDVPGLTALHEAVAGALRAAGVEPAANHGFTPHLTLGYDLDGACTRSSAARRSPSPSAGPQPMRSHSRWAAETTSPSSVRTWAGRRSAGSQRRRGPSPPGSQCTPRTPAGC